MKTYTEQDLREAMTFAINQTREGWNGEYAERINPNIEECFDSMLNEYIESLNPKQEEKTIPLTAGYLLKKLDWEEFCNLTGIDYYATREGYVIKDDEVFHIPESKVKQFI